MNTNTIDIARSEARLRDADWTIDLQAVDRLDLSGGKALNLARMIECGLPVPPGIVLTDTAFQEFIAHGRLDHFIESRLGGLDARDSLRLQESAAEIRARILAAEIPPLVWDSVVNSVRNGHSSGPWIVRSSAIGEDSLDAAFAGQLDSIPGIRTEAELRDAIVACWASYWSPRVIYYQQTRGVTLRGMGVIIQQQIASRISGVLFTESPCRTHDRETALLVEYCFGAGELLVSGQVNPGRLSIDRGTRICQRLAKPEQKEDGCDELLFRQTERLATAALDLERLFGAPQDIEWTIDPDGQLFFVQSRAITTTLPARSAPPLAPVVTGRGGAPLVHWSNANVNENFPDPICPLLYSIASAGYYHYFRNLALAMGISRRRVRAMEHSLRNIIGVHGARMYYNLSHVHDCLRLAPFGELLAGWFDNFVGADNDSPVVSDDPSIDGATLVKPLAVTGKMPERSDLASASPADSPRRPFWRPLFEATRVAWRMVWHFSFLSRRVASFERTADTFAESTRADALAKRSLLELRNDLAHFMDIRCHRWLNASLADSAALLSYGLLKRLVQPELSPDEQGLHNSLLKGLRDVVSSAPIVELWELSRSIRANDAWRELMITRDAPELWLILQSGDEQYSGLRRAADAYLEKWGFRCSGELMLTVPSYQERPESLLTILRAYVASDRESPHDRLRTQELERTAMTHELLGRLRNNRRRSWLARRGRAWLAGIALRWAHASIAYRERARLKQAMLYSRCRRIVLEIGARLVNHQHLSRPADIFYLTVGEILELLSGGAMFPDQIGASATARRRWHCELSNSTPPDSFRLPEGEYLSSRQGPTGMNRSPDTHQAHTPLAGVGACGGRVSGRASILTDVTQCEKLCEGDVLVTRQTDPGWAPVFFLIKGLVMERGGMLSHGAILAREYGIPTVVGVHDATRRIGQGEMIQVDGDRGVVLSVDS
ncbi:MAG: hypothetical protein FJ295_04625 [Planctomycetes bacterium]|nr:hypothetical protein [Planctomycetota bacterium]